jgi:cadmium resistance protein CadD (predicted permease)
MIASRDLVAIAPMIFLQALLPLLLFSVPFIVDLYLGNGSVTIFVEILTYLNFSNELILLTFFVVLALLILHRLIWPVLSRLVYALAKYRIVHQPVVMAGLGIACLLAAFQHAWLPRLK